nr:hypothetical protein [Mesotoga sp. HF07.pep.5.2.highcov]
MNRRLVFVLLMVLLSLSILIANTIELEFWTHEDPNRTPLEERFIEEFQEMYPNVVIKRVTQSSTKIQELILTLSPLIRGRTFSICQLKMNLLTLQMAESPLLIMKPQVTKTWRIYWHHSFPEL